jgi:uncharacterized protein YerC
MGLKELKAIERRKRIRKFIRQGLTQVEIAEREQIDVTTVNEDVNIITQENAGRLLANRELVDKDLENLLNALRSLEQIDEECWKIYYEDAVAVDKLGMVVKDSIGNPIRIEQDSKTKLEALDKIRQNNLDRAKLLKLLNPTQINIEKLVYVEKMMPVLVNKMIDLVILYTPKEKQVELLEKLRAIDIEGELK